MVQLKTDVEELPSPYTLGTPGTLQAVLPVNGEPRRTTSYRAELFGILGALMTLHHLLPQNNTWNNLTGTLWCDNKAVVTKYNDLCDSLPFSLTEANESDADVLQELQHWKAKLPVAVTAAWVKAHQQNPTSREARLNNVADRLAATQHSKTGHLASTHKAHRLPHTYALLRMGDSSFTGKIDRGIQSEIYRPKMRDYIVQKLNLAATQHLVDWESVGWLHCHFSLQRRTTRLKFIFHWAPTNARKVETNQGTDPRCPLCRHSPETTHHVLSCDSERARSHREEALRKLESQLTSSGTHPDLTTMVLEAT